MQRKIDFFYPLGGNFNKKCLNLKEYMLVVIDGVPCNKKNGMPIKTLHNSKIAMFLGIATMLRHK